MKNPAGLLLLLVSSCAWSVQPAIGSLCHTPETTYFSCWTTRHTTVSLCGTLPSSLQYRYGKGAQVELQFPDDPATGAVDLHHLAVEHEADAVLGVPVQVVEYDLFELLFAGQHRGEQDAVVVGMRLGTEHRDVVEVAGELEQLLQGSYAGKSWF